MFFFLPIPSRGSFESEDRVTPSSSPQPGGGGEGRGQDPLFTFTNFLSKLMDKCMPKLVFKNFPNITFNTILPYCV